MTTNLKKHEFSFNKSLWANVEYISCCHHMVKLTGKGANKYSLVGRNEKDFGSYKSVAEAKQAALEFHNQGNHGF